MLILALLLFHLCHVPAAQNYYRKEVAVSCRYVQDNIICTFYFFLAVQSNHTYVYRFHAMLVIFLEQGTLCKCLVSENDISLACMHMHGDDIIIFSIPIKHT